MIDRHGNLHLRAVAERRAPRLRPLAGRALQRNERSRSRVGVNTTLRRAMSRRERTSNGAARPMTSAIVDVRFWSAL